MQNLDLNKPEPPPTTGNIDVWPLVIADMVERDAVGRAKYGVPLRTNNGRRPLVDLYQELLDAVAGDRGGEVQPASARRRDR